MLLAFYAVALLGVAPIFTLCHRGHGMPANHVCDDGQAGVSNDFMMVKKELWTCQGPFMSSIKKPKAVVEDKCYPIEKNGHYCVGQEHNYDTDPPLSGMHRQVWPVYGEYSYLPAPRYMHGLEHGGIVVLYNPCAPPGEVSLLKRVVSGCLRRHLITPYVNLSTPMAVLSWGCILRLNHVDELAVRAWIQRHAFQTGGESAMYNDGGYTYALKSSSRVVSDMRDTTLCPHLPSETVSAETVTPTPTPASTSPPKPPSTPAPAPPSSSPLTSAPAPPSSSPLTSAPAPPSSSLSTSAPAPASSSPLTSAPAPPSSSPSTSAPAPASSSPLMSAPAPQSSSPPTSQSRVSQPATRLQSRHHSASTSRTSPTSRKASSRSRPAATAAGTTSTITQPSTSAQDTATSTTPTPPAAASTPPAEDTWQGAGNGSAGVAAHCQNATLHHCLRAVAQSRTVWAAVAVSFLVLLLLAGLLCMHQKTPLACSSPLQCCCWCGGGGRKRYHGSSQAMSYGQSGARKQPLAQQFRENLSTRFVGGKTPTADYFKLRQNEEDDDVL